MSRNGDFEKLSNLLSYVTTTWWGCVQTQVTKSLHQSCYADFHVIAIILSGKKKSPREFAFVLSCFSAGESPHVELPGACVLSCHPTCRDEGRGGHTPLSGAGAWTAGEMWELYPAKLCGFLWPVNWQQTVEPNQLPLPVLTEGGRGASQGTDHCKGRSLGSLWPCGEIPACFAEFLLGTEFTQARPGEFGPLPTASKDPMIFIFNSCYSYQPSLVWLVHWRERQQGHQYWSPVTRFQALSWGLWCTALPALTCDHLHLH